MAPGADGTMYLMSGSWLVRPLAVENIELSRIMGEISSVSAEHPHDAGGIKFQNEDELRLAQMG